ncbi:threonine-phosphate decarboxylase [Paracoccus benzoatiresistens]|uniref:Threonine-phosphate decarboxylase n=1 Tax=Paracoccus benzoatiresistens TaxID=2997341 RepID=A0ABT4J488_9RHOB|nr:threonine-phosphate decarboxylase [Paracoccus sp. EF6]MCZ0961950.1 threonine-phosphate decarboxylase [Paracoccus sp. EF6]
MQRMDLGDIEKAAAQAGAGDWIDLSKGINRRPWPVPDLPPDAVRDPGMATQERLIRVAAEWFGCLPAQVLPVAGAPAAMIPRLFSAGRAAVIAPGQQRHTTLLRAAGWKVAQVPTAEGAAGADLALVANPGNPDGREWSPDLLARLARSVGYLVVDESLADARPDLSLAPALPPNALVLRSLGPLWGLRLGFVLANPALRGRLSASRPVGGRVLHIGALAMADRPWADDTILYLAEAALRLDRLASAAGWRPAGGTHLFRLYDTGDAAAAQDRLARAHVRARRFPWSATWLRLGIPVSSAEWDRLATPLR